MTTTPTSGAADLPKALRLAAAISNLLCSNEAAARTLAAAADELVRLHAESEMRRAALLDETQKTALAAGQATAAPAQPAPAGADQADSVPTVEREQERIAFKDAHRHLDLDEVPDAWGRLMFKHSHIEASWLGWIARASHEQASSQAGEYSALVCDYCGALTPDPWHSSGMLHGKMSKHIHSCDACAARGAAHGIKKGGQRGTE